MADDNSFRFVRLLKVPLPGELWNYTRSPPSFCQNIPSAIPEHENGIFVTTIPSGKIMGNFDSLFSDMRPWICRIRSEADGNGNVMKKRGSMHYDYYAWDGTGPRRQTSSKDASAVRIRCVHHSGLISKFVFHIYGEQLAVCVLKIEDGWRSALLSAPKGHLPKSITAVVRQHVGSGILDCDKVRDDVYKATGTSVTRSKDAKAAIFGTRRNLSPEVPRVVTMSALDVAASERPAYVDALRIHARAKDWFHNHSREVESVALESRLVALHGMESSTTNGVEGLNKEIPQWTGNGRNLPEVVENLQDRMEMMDRDLALSVLQRSDEITCERAGADRERVLKSLGMESTLVDVFSTLPFYDRIEATFSAKLLTGYRRQACELVVHSFSTVQHATFQKESGEVECVNFSEGTRVCSCRPASGMCAHILAVWNFLDPPDAAASIVKYLEVTEARAERYHKERSAGGSKCGKARRRTGTESTRRQNNLDVGEFVPNPYHIDAGVDKRSGYCGVDSAVETESLSHAVFAALSVDGIGDDLPADY